MTKQAFPKANKYTNLKEIYAQCSGPGALELTEFLAHKMGLLPGARLLDVGCNRGVQSCFLAREFGVRVVAMDPWNDRMDGRPMVEHAAENAARWGVADMVRPIKLGVPDTGLEADSFDYVYSTTALEMVRALGGEDLYLACVEEILRVLKPGGVFGLAEPMHLDRPIPADLRPLVTTGEFAWADCFVTVGQTADALQEAGFEIMEAAYAPDSWRWWMEFVENDPFCIADPENDPKILLADGGRWASVGFVIANKPFGGELQGQA